jgi:hypothetical protein
MLPGADTAFGHKLLVAKICIRMKKNHEVPGRKTQGGIWRSYMLSGRKCKIL